MQKKELSKAVLKRLPTYLSYLKRLPADAPTFISATSIANALGMGEVQVRKDLAMVSDGVITARVKVTRGVSKEDFKTLVSRSGNYDDSYLNMTDIQLFVSQSSSCGYRARDERWSNEIKYTGKEFDTSFGKTITITSNPKNPIPSGRKVFIRAAARINYDTPAGSGTKRWNYSETVEIDIP